MADFEGNFTKEFGFCAMSYGESLKNFSWENVIDNFTFLKCCLYGVETAVQWGGKSNNPREGDSSDCGWDNGIIPVFSRLNQNDLVKSQIMWERSKDYELAFGFLPWEDGSEL